VVLNVKLHKRPLGIPEYLGALYCELRLRILSPSRLFLVVKFNQSPLLCD
jgi:hypothetical protein